VVEPEKTSVVKEARAVLDEAKKNRQRVAELARSGISSTSELDTVEASYTVALNRYEASLEEARTRQATLAQRRAELELARQQLADTNVRCPFDGAVQARIANRGEFLAGGAPVLRLVKTDPLRLRVEVPERDAARVALQQRVRVHLEGDSEVHAGTVARLSPALDERNRMLMVEADVPNNGALRPGSFVRAEVVVSERENGLVVPPESIITFAGLEKVIVVHEGQAQEKTVTTGRRGRDWVEILHGLKSDQLVVMDPGNLRTGQRVQVAEVPGQARLSVESSDP
jgi:RND family efflux transporter MFP subunit